MNTSRRIALKLCWMGLLIATLIIFAQLEHEFVYRAF
jgi:hypothetical protein